MRDLPFVPRRSLQGGRCAMHGTFCRVNLAKGERQHHVDLHSLYPKVLTEEYPIGLCMHMVVTICFTYQNITGAPRILFGSYANDLNWLHQKFPYFVLHAILLPPRSLRVPIVGFHVYNES